MYPRSEFPVEKLPAIVRPNGSISRAALVTRFSAVGCPHGNVDVTVAAIKSGVDLNVAFQLGMLAYYANEMSTDCIERTCRHITRTAEKRHAEKFPQGKCAEDLAAAREGRPSRWGTPEFHGAVGR
jgi:hypothetical protein